MPPPKQKSRTLYRIACALPPLINTYRRAKNFTKTDSVVTGFYRKIFERNRLVLPSIEAEILCPPAQSIVLPVFYPLFAGEDAPLNDLVFLLNLAKGLKVRRILEVGTYRARTTYAFQQNCPDAEIISYDIQVLESPFRKQLSQLKNVELRHESFTQSAEILKSEKPFDLIFIDGSHQFEMVIQDSELALQLIAAGGVIVWHDYRHNNYFNKELKVPEALNILRKEHEIFAVPQTYCAVYQKKHSDFKRVS